MSGLLGAVICQAKIARIAVVGIRTVQRIANAKRGTFSVKRKLGCNNRQPIFLPTIILPPTICFSQQDGASVHTATRVQNFLSRSFVTSGLPTSVHHQVLTSIHSITSAGRSLILGWTRHHTKISSVSKTRLQNPQETPDERWKSLHSLGRTISSVLTWKRAVTSSY